MIQYEYHFYVSAKIEINGATVACSTWESSESYDKCHQKIEKLIKSKKKDPSDEVITHILGTGERKHKVYYNAK